MSSSSEKKMKSITSSKKSAKSSTEILLERFEILETNCQELTQSIKQINDEIQALRPVLMEVLETSAKAESPNIFPDNDLKVSATSKKKPTAATKTKVLDEEDTTESLFPPQKNEPVTPSILTEEEFVNAINTLPVTELEGKLTTANAKKNVIKNISNERKKRDFQPFESTDDMVERIKGLAEHSLRKIIEEFK